MADASPLAYVRARIHGPNGFLKTVSLAAENQLEFDFVGATTLPESAALGSYWVDQVNVADELGNSALFDEAALNSEYGYSREFQLYDGPDNEAPTIHDLTISPASVDTSGGPATVTMTIHATDALSGVDGIFGSFDMPNAFGNYGFSMPQKGGRDPDGEWSMSIELPRHAAPGEWKLDELHVSDNAGNSDHYYSRPEVESIPFSTAFTQSGPGDTTPPGILGLSIDEAFVSGRHVVYFDVHLIDDLAGINARDNCLWLVARSLAQPTYTFVVTSPTEISGTALDGVLRMSATFADAAPIGAYEVESLEACDLTWNLTTLSGATLEGKGFDLTFVNPG